jgi:hypothetical protein
LAEMQVVEDQGPPSSHSLGVFFCTFCRTRLHGHGWRKRYFITDSLSSLQLWIHRKLCPCCRKTYTLLPVWVHAFKLFSLETICQDRERTLQHHSRHIRLPAAQMVEGIFRQKPLRKRLPRPRTAVFPPQEYPARLPGSTAIGKHCAKQGSFTDGAEAPLPFPPTFVSVCAEVHPLGCRYQLLEVPHPWIHKRRSR